MDKLAWGIIGTGRIAGKFASELPLSHTGALVAVGSRSQESADRFGNEYNVPKRYGSYEELLADPDVRAVYISTPHPMHAEWAIKAAEAGKHILCEKPITINFPEAMAVVDAARKHDVFLMEAFMYRCHPQTAKLVELIREGAVGEVRMIQATFSFNAGFAPESRLFANELGGGGILDVGCYAVSMSRLVAGAALGLPFVNPVEIKSMGHIGETGIDEWSAALLRFPNDIIAQVATGVRVNQDNSVRVYGSQGHIVVPVPWFCSPAKLILHRAGQPEPEEIIPEADRPLYAVEADTVARYIEQRQAPSPAMSTDDTLGNMDTLDKWRVGFGLLYNIEKPDANYPTADGRPLAARRDSNMPYGHIEGVANPVSRIATGCMLGATTITLPHISILLDEFFKRGGNLIDTAYVYGAADRFLGRWIRNRGVRKDLVILAKGAHTPFCYPEALTAQFNETLENLGSDYVDIYMMHRDNPEVPVGEFIDVLNEHRSAGRMRAFGVSNWTIDRIEAANEYAKSKGLHGFSAVSNNFSLARMVEAPWADCISASDIESREWFIRNKMPLISWSSQSQGFFARGNRDDLSNHFLARCWYSDDNFQRLERVRELAEKKGASPAAVALAYVLRQPMDIYAITGPATLAEMDDSFHALQVDLTSDEMKWLNLEA